MSFCHGSKRTSFLVWQEQNPHKNNQQTLLTVWSLVSGATKVARPNEPNPFNPKRKSPKRANPMTPNKKPPGLAPHENRGGLQSTGYRISTPQPPNPQRAKQKLARLCEAKLPRLAGEMRETEKQTPRRASSPPDGRTLASRVKCRQLTSTCLNMVLYSRFFAEILEI